jgi:glutamate dehydrogenase
MTNLNIRQQLLKRIATVADKQLDGSDAKVFRQFLDQVVHVHPDESQLSWEADANFGLLYGLYDFVSQRAESESLVKVFNPDLESDGWLSKHTVIYYCQPDRPFLVDSLRIALNNSNLNVHVFESNLMWVERSPEGILESLSTSRNSDACCESVGYVLIDTCSDQSVLHALTSDLRTASDDVERVVEHFPAMLERLQACIDESERTFGEDNEEAVFLRWLRDGNFTFLGMSDFLLSSQNDQPYIAEVPDNQLGLMGKRAPLPAVALTELCQGFADFYAQRSALAFTKTSQKSTVHRHVYADYIVIKRFNEQGQAVGETRVLGLYTAGMYYHSVERIPLLRSKAQWLRHHSQLDGASHNGKTFALIIERHPRDELIQAEQSDLLDALLAIWKIYERRAVKLVLRVDRFEKFVSCIVYLPREAVKMEKDIERLLGQAIGSSDCELSTQFLSESVLARMQLVYRIHDQQFRQLDRGALEAEIIELCRDWRQRFTELCIERHGEETGRSLALQYQQAFSAAYRDRFSPLLAVNDIELCRRLTDSSDISISLFHQAGSDDNRLRLKLFHREESLQLSDILPMLEKMGSRVLVEHPYQICPDGESDIWMHDFVLEHDLGGGRKLNLESVRDSYEDALRAIWQGKAENDSFNRLVIGARLDWRSVALIRAYARYIKQLGSLLSLDFIASVLSSNVDITRDLMALFRCLFDPRRGAQKSSEERENKLRDGILHALDEVQNLNEDQVLRQYLECIDATLRCNFFQQDDALQYRDCIALKISTRDLSFAPAPRPEYEIFVFSPRVEGVHLRGGKVARGGIRWSDRLEDYRTEILGLVKAQQVKNAVIVPTGAKGGFVARRSAQLESREELFSEGVACYKLFIGSLLDITDNREGDRVVPPESVVCRDDDDPYLVVAADKGTASFSDIANDIALSRGFWLGDAFASGGSNGYDHKAMGITARGAWVAVQRHFRELGIDVQRDPVTVIGIGDMGGDVFGNGMLLSKSLKVVAAFNHLHIFIDPVPDAEASWQERKRLFERPRSSWADYSTELISTGGGVFSRSAKQVPLSPEMQQLLACDDAALTPTQLIRRLLQAKVDLIWNGGIGTYVKAAEESHADVGDRANDPLRINGSELRCRVFGEGGNLGVTQLGRLEFCRNGGICNTDFIDNAAGVDCSDHEVNIKILLNAQLESEDLTSKQRNQLLADMTDDVASLVLHNNYRQTLAISLASYSRDKHHHDYLRFVEHLEETGALNRELEFLPDNERINELHSEGKSWTRPELALLVSYAKVELKEQLMALADTDDPWLLERVYRAFPQRLRRDYASQIRDHRLAREIIATQLANELVNIMGFRYSHRQEISLGATAVETACAFVTVVELFGIEGLWRRVEALDQGVDSTVQYALFHQIMRLGRRSTRWFLRNIHHIQPSRLIEKMQPGFAALMPCVVENLRGVWAEEYRSRSARWIDAGVPEELATTIAAFDAYFMLPGCVDAALEVDCPAERFSKLQFTLLETLQMDWALQVLISWQPGGRWQDLARESYVDSLESLLRQLSIGLLSDAQRSLSDILDSWQTDNQSRLSRYHTIIDSVRIAAAEDLSVFTVVLRELQDLVDASLAQLPDSSLPNATGEAGETS